MIKNVSLNLMKSTRFSDDPWIRLEEVTPESDEAELDDVAEFIDQLYGTSICDESYYIPVCGASKEDGWPGGQPKEVPTQEEITAVASEVLNIQSCNGDKDYFTSEIKIFRSQQDIPYKVVLQYGEILSDPIIREEITYTVEVEKANQLKLAYPVDGGRPSTQWVGDVVLHEGTTEVPDILYNENGYLYWAGSVTGSIKITLSTIYNLLKIKAPRELSELKNGFPDDYKGGDCLCLVFWNSTVTDILVNEPEIQYGVSIDGLICPEAAADKDTDGYSTDYEHKGHKGDTDAYCYKMESIIYKCNCDGETSHIEHVERQVDCKENANPGRHLKGSYETVEYIDCGDIEKVHDPIYYEDRCCDPPDVALPKCKKRITINKGGKTISDEDKAKYRALYGDSVEFIGVSPDSGDCGTTTTIQDVPSGGCCIGAPDMSWVTTHSKVEWGQSYVFTVSGGTPPYNWTSEGQGLSISGSGSSAKLTVSDCFCKPGQVIVIDSCDKRIAHSVSSENGWWSEIPFEEVPDSFRNIPGEIIGYSSGISPWIRAETEEYAVQQTYSKHSTGGVYYFAHYDDISTVPGGCGDSVSSTFILDRFGGATEIAYVAPPEDTGWVKIEDGVFCATSNFEYYNDNQPVGDGFQGNAVAYIVKFLTYATAYKWKCNDWDELIFDTENSADVIADDSSGYVRWEGGRPPFTVSVSGQGFSANSNGESSLTTDNRYAKIYTEDACGVCNITVRDYCGNTVSGTARSTTGNWSEKIADVNPKLTGAGEAIYKGRRLEQGGLIQYEYYTTGSPSATGSFESGHDCDLCGTDRTKDWYDGYMPYSRTSPCMTNPPEEYPCYFWTYQTTERTVCSFVTGRSYEEWRC